MKHKNAEGCDVGVKRKRLVKTVKSEYLVLCFVQESKRVWTETVGVIV